MTLDLWPGEFGEANVLSLDTDDDVDDHLHGRGAEDDEHVEDAPRPPKAKWQVTCLLLAKWQVTCLLLAKWKVTRFLFSFRVPRCQDLKSLHKISMQSPFMQIQHDRKMERLYKGLAPRSPLRPNTPQVSFDCLSIRQVTAISHP